MEGAVLPVFFGLLKEQAWVPISVLAVAIMIYFMFKEQQKLLKEQKEQIKAREEESKKREEDLNKLVKEQKKESKERQEELTALVEQTKVDSKQREEQIKAEALAREERSKEESRIREERLMNHLDQQSPILTEMVSSLKMIQTRMEIMERTLNLDPKVVVKVDNTKDGGIIT